MCLIVFAYKTHPEYKLILAANRDEFYKRPTREAQFWEEEGYPDILAGKDLEAGGTWMGINKAGNWSALTNYRDFSFHKENPPSRGDLVMDYLKLSSNAEEYIDKIKSNAALYNGFNILVGDDEHLLHYSNFSKTVTAIEPGIHGVSNALLDTPWVKLEQAKADLKKVVAQTEIDTEELFLLLKNDQRAPDESLPQTGLEPEMEKAVSSVFIKTDVYGTRCSTLLLIKNDGSTEFVERRYIAGTEEVEEESAFNF